MAEVFAKVEKGDARIIEANDTGYTLHTVTSGRIFALKTLIVTNRSGDCEVNLYDAASGGPQIFGTSGQPLLRLIVGAVKTEAYGDDFLKGVNFVSSIVAFASVSGTFCRIGGFEW
jgi:hypothetical protein